jgi:ubiquinone/menaquinone biosynthesis C-methylase UbiE
MTYKDKRQSNVVGSKAGYDDYAVSYDKTLDFLDSFERDVLQKMLRDVRSGKVLDVGCGTGRVIRKLLDRGAEIVGLDVSPEMLKIARKKFKKTTFIEGNIENMLFPDEDFDMVIASFVIVHLKNLQKAFDEVYRILKPGGVFIVTNINQRKSPKLKNTSGKEIVIKSFYHIPEQVISALKESFFDIETEEFVYENSIWVNQIVKAIKR